MGEASIPVDLSNPGQVFASLGFMEAAAVLLGDVSGAFDWSRPEGARFLLRSTGEGNPFAHVLRFLSNAKVVASAPHQSANIGAWKKSWGAIEPLDEGTPYPSPDPDTPATLQARIREASYEISIDHWTDATRRDPTKFWAGGAGYPGAALARDALELVRSRCAEAVDDPFAVSAPQKSSFRLDWRRDYIPLDAGFSLNNHQNITTVGFPIVELLGAVGLGNARPERLASKLEYRYCVLGRDHPSSSLWLPPSLLRAGLGGAPLPFPTRRFQIVLGWPGKPGQARAITNVIEETR